MDPRQRGAQDAIAANSVLVREDDPSEAIFFIADGLFEVYVFAGPTTRFKVGQLGPGEVIGEISWLDRKPISASVRAVETSAVMALSTAMLERKLAEDPGFAARLFRGIATLTAGASAQDDGAGAPLGMGCRTAPATAGGEPAASSHKVGELEALGWRRGDGKGAMPDEDATQDRARCSPPFDRSIAPQGVKNAAGISRALQAELLPLVSCRQRGAGSTPSLAATPATTRPST